MVTEATLNLGKFIIATIIVKLTIIREERARAAMAKEAHSISDSVGHVLVVLVGGRGGPTANGNNSGGHTNTQ